MMVKLTDYRKRSQELDKREFDREAESVPETVPVR